MNKCDLEETKKQVDDIIAAAIKDEAGWEYHNGRGYPRDYSHLCFHNPRRAAEERKKYEKEVEEWRAKRDESGFYHDQSGVSAIKRGGERLNPPPQKPSPIREELFLHSAPWPFSIYRESRLTVNVEVGGGSKDTTPLDPQEEPKFAPFYWQLRLNEYNVSKAEEGSEQFAFFKALEKKKMEDDQCKRLLAAMNPKKKKEEAPPSAVEDAAEEPPSTEGSASLGIFMACMFLLLFAVAASFASCSSPPKILEQQPVEGVQ